MRDVIIFLTLVISVAMLGCMSEEQTAPPSQVTTTPPPTTSAPPMTNAVEGKSLFEIKCSLCHSLNRPASKSKSYDGWLSTVHRMIGNGAPLTDEEAEIIAAYLAQTYGEE